MSACCAVCSKICGGTLLAIRCLCCGALNTTLISVFLDISSFLCSIPVHWPVYSVGLWLLRNYQGDRPKESNRPHQTARQHRRNSREHWFQCKLKVAVVCSAGQLNKVLVSWARCWFWFCVCAQCLSLCRSTLLQKTGCTKKPGVCFWSQKWWIVLQWSWSGTSRMKKDWSNSCAKRNSSGELNIDSFLSSALPIYLVWLRWSVVAVTLTTHTFCLMFDH